MMGEGQRIEDTFQTVGSNYGYELVKAQFRPFKEFKTTWERCGAQADFKVTDYLQAASDVVLEDFAHCIFKRIQKRRREVYTDRLRDWLRSQEFVSRNRPLYLDRSRNLRMNSKGESYDLQAMAEHLRSQGLIADCQDAYISWTDRPNRFRMGYCSLLMRVVAISSVLDSVKVPDLVTEYVLYHELLHLERGIDSLRSQHDAAFRRAERMYPRWRESEDWLKRIASGR